MLGQSRWPAFGWVWEVICPLPMWGQVVSIRSQGAISSGADWATPKLKPTEFEVNVEFSPPRVIRVPGDFQAVSIEPVVQDLMPYDQAEVNFQCGPKADPDCDEVSEEEGNLGQEKSTTSQETAKDHLHKC